MREVNGFFIFELGQIWQLVPIQEGPIESPQLLIIVPAINTLKALIEFENNKVNFPHTVESAITLCNLLQQLISKDESSYTTQERQNIVSSVFHFRTLFASELGKITSILLEDKRGYSVNALWKNPNTLIANDIFLHLSDFVKENIKEAAKCLVLDCFTAVGFHSMRSVECVARKYYELIFGKPPTYKNKNNKERHKGLGTIINELLCKSDKLQHDGSQYGDLPIIAPLLRGLCKIYRDPLSHPEIRALEESEATEVFVDSIQVISRVVRDAITKGRHFVIHWDGGPF